MKNKRIECVYYEELISATILDKIIICSNKGYTEHRYLVRNDDGIIMIIDPKSIRQVDN